MDGEQWDSLFYGLARFLPGLGGPEQFGTLSVEEAFRLYERLRDDFEREAEQLRRSR